MSEQKTDGQLAEVDTTVVISPEDCNAALDFWRHFNIPIPQDLQTAFDEFSKDPSFVNQNKVKLQVTKAIAETDHAAFKDEMFTKIVEECAAVSFEMQFDKDIETTLSVEKE
jgi:hypothetical protein